MRTIRLLPVLLSICLCSSCVPLASVYPLWDAEHVTELPGLEGIWTDTEGGRLTITKVAAAQYTATYEGDREVSRYEMRVVDLNGRFFMDFFPDTRTLERYLDVKGEVYLPLVPAHFFGLFTLSGESLELGLLDDEQVARKVEKREAAAVPLLKSKDGIVMTAETKAVQSLLDGLADDASVWGDRTIFTRKN